MKPYRLAALAALAGSTLIALASCGGNDDHNGMSSASSHAFKSTMLVSDGSTTAAHTDANLKNGWGVAFNPTGFVWVANNGTNTSTLYDGNGVVQSLVVTIPPNAAGVAAGPNGIVFNKTTDFPVSTAGGTPSNGVFLFSTDAGTIAGWSPKVLPTQAVTAVDNSAQGAVYKGLAIGVNNGQNVLYAADLHNRRIDVFDKSFNRVQLSASPFVDPNLPAGFTPFNVAVFGNNVYVAYALLGASGTRQQNGAGNGVIDVFDPAGNFVKRLVTQGPLNSPWGMAMAPSNFGPFSNDLLVGNFGDGTIHAFDPNSGALIGTMTNADGSTFNQPGIWGLAFGNNVQNQPLNTLFFAAGPTPTTGVYGRIDVQTN